jgi:glycosyltransferase involved in cell wall biosynthesis
MGLRSLLRHKRVLFDGVNSLRDGFAPIILELARLGGKRCAVYWHEMAWIIEQARSARSVRRTLQNREVVHFHVCERGRQELVQRYGVSGERTRVLPNMARAEGADLLNLQTSVPGLFVAAGPLQEWKGPDLFLDVAQNVCVKRPEARFIWMGRCGQGRYSWAAMREEANRRALGPRVMFLGQVERPLEIMARAEAVLLTSRSEGTPKVVIEALALGKKVVAFDVGGVAEALDGLGCVVPLGDVDALCAALLDTSDAEAEDLRKRRRQRYREHFTPEAFAARFGETVSWWDSL